MGKEKKQASKVDAADLEVVPMEVNEEIGSQNEHVIENNKIDRYNLSRYNIQ